MWQAGGKGIECPGHGGGTDQASTGEAHGGTLARDLTCGVRAPSPVTVWAPFEHTQ